MVCVSFDKCVCVCRRGIRGAPAHLLVRRAALHVRQLHHGCQQSGATLVSAAVLRRSCGPDSALPSPSQWHPLLSSLRQAAEERSGCSFNSLLCNLYRDGRDSIGWHSDDEASLGATPTIASLSLGDTRVFSLRKQPPPVSAVSPQSCQL